MRWAAKCMHYTGIGFFDRPHGQTGRALNGLELHPLLDIEFNPTGVTPTPTPAALLQNPGFESGNVGWTATAGIISNKSEPTATQWFVRRVAWGLRLGPHRSAVAAGEHPLDHDGRVSDVLPPRHHGRADDDAGARQAARGGAAGEWAGDDVEDVLEPPGGTGLHAGETVNLTPFRGQTITIQRS